MKFTQSNLVLLAFERDLTGTPNHDDTRSVVIVALSCLHVINSTPRHVSGGRLWLYMTGALCAWCYA